MIFFPLTIYFVVIGEPIYALVLICTVASAGLSVLGCYALDSHLQLRRQLKETEQREAALREKVLNHDEGQT